MVNLIPVPRYAYSYYLLELDCGHGWGIAVRPGSLPGGTHACVLCGCLRTVTGARKVER